MSPARFFVSELRLVLGRRRNQVLLVILALVPLLVKSERQSGKPASDPASAAPWPKRRPRRGAPPRAGPDKREGIILLRCHPFAAHAGLQTRPQPRAFSHLAESRGIPFRCEQ